VGGSVVASKLKKESTPADMVFISGGTCRMGSNRHYPEEAPRHRVTVSDFWIDRTPVTNRQFRKFVNETGYVTFTELRPDAKDYPGALPHMLKAGSLVFTPPKHPVDLTDWSQCGSSNSAPTRTSKFHAKCSKDHTCGAELLPPLSSGRSSRATGRYVHKPCRIPACHQKMER
jgi:formylglycine-generating enzyme required for sulfatase activity